MKLNVGDKVHPPTTLYTCEKHGLVEPAKYVTYESGQNPGGPEEFDVCPTCEGKITPEDQPAPEDVLYFWERYTSNPPFSLTGRGLSGWEWT